MKNPLAFMLSFLFLLCVASFIAGVSLNSGAAFWLSSAALLPFVAIFAVGVLDYRVGGSQLTLERRVNSLEEENTELKRSVTALLRSMYVLSSDETPIAGPSKEQYRLIDNYLSPIKHLIDGDIDVKASVHNEVRRAHEHRNP